MARRRFTFDEVPNRERWVVSYADFITLLFAFFTMLYAMTIQDAANGRAVTDSISDSFSQSLVSFSDRQRSSASEDKGTPIPLMDAGESQSQTEDRRLDSLGERTRELANGEGHKNGMRVRRTEEGLVISLASQMYFPAGANGLAPAFRDELAKLARLVSQVPNHIRVEGHTDSLPVRSSRYPTNWELSSARAVQIVRALQEQGVPAHRLSAAGYADQRPLVSNATVEGRGINRRVDIVLLRSRLAASDL